MQVNYCSKHTDLNVIGYADALLGIMCTTYGHLFADPWLFSYHKPTYLRKQDLLFYRISDLELFRFSFFFVLPCRLRYTFIYSVLNTSSILNTFWRRVASDGIPSYPHPCQRPTRFNIHDMCVYRDSNSRGVASLLLSTSHEALPRAG